MAGLGLTNALGMYQQGLGVYNAQQDRQRQQQQIAKQEARQAQLEAANKAAAGFIEQTRAKAPNPEQWQPDDDTMFQAGAVRSRELARAGLFEDLAQNEVALEKQRMRARGSALQNWRLKRDPKQLIAQAYSTIPDGGTVQDVQPLDGGKRVKVKFSTGTEQEIDPEQLAGALEASLVEPQKYAEMSIRRNMETALVEARNKARLGEIDAQHQANMARDEVNNKARADRTEATNDSRETQTEMRVKGGLQAAEIRAANRGGGGARASGGGGASGFQRTFAGDDGFMYGIPRQGGEAIRITANGQPIRAVDYGKRVDKLAGELDKTREGMGKPLAERRKMAEQILTTSSPAARPPLTQFGGQPQQQPQQRPPLTNFIR